MTEKAISIEKLDANHTYFKIIKKIPVLTQDQEVKLAKRVKQGDKVAKNKFIKSNLRLGTLSANPR